MQEPPAPPLSLGGSLADFPLAEVLTFLNLGQRSGAIEILSGPGANRLYLRSGEVVFARSRNPRLQLAEFLVDRGVLTDDAARELADYARRQGRPLRDVVVARGILSEEEMGAFEKILVSEIVFEAMRWSDGKFAFLKDREPETGITRLRISIENLILEWARREDEANRLEREGGPDRELVVTLVCSTGHLEQQVVLTPVEWGVISLINGKRTLDEIFSLSPAASEAESWAILQRIQAARLVRMHRKGESDADALDGEPSTSPAARGADEPKPTTQIPIPDLDDDRPTVLVPRPSPPAVDLLEKSDVRLISGDDVTTAHGMYGVKKPARLVSPETAESPAWVFDLDRPVITVGRADSNDLVLAGRSVSKQHAQFTRDGEGWLLRDLNSTNGTRINGEKTTEGRLQPGDQIQIGAYSMFFDVVEIPQ